MEKKLLITALIILINLVFTINIFYNNSTAWSPTWTSRAAEEAEDAASVSCSGHGRAYVDGLGIIDGNKPPFECNNCYTGKDCSFLLSDYPADANSGDPLFLEPFWMQNAEGSAVVESGWHRMSYFYHKDGQYISAELERIIRKLHNVVGNAVTDNRLVIFGTGSTQLIAASVHALSQTNSSSPSRLVSSVPYYYMNKELTEVFNYAHIKFEGDASAWKKSEHNDNMTQVIEIVTSPNNPDGKLKRAVLEGPSVKTVHDYAYYWPHLSPITHPADEDLSLFSLTKATGHAGSRFGVFIVVLVKDKAVYERMKRYITLSSIGVSKDTQLREMFHFGYRTLKKRWETLNKIFSISTRFSLQTIQPEYCHYFKKVRDFTPSYAWVKCERLKDSNCFEIFREAKIIGREGKAFGSEDSTTWNPSWTNRAAEEAEDAASVSCSGHGRAYIDGLGVLDGNKTPCECNNCYTGDYCSFLLPDCHADANSRPFVLGAILDAEPERIIRNLHNLVGNAVTDNRYVIFGTGATRLIAASVHALSQTNSSSPSRLVSPIPYYNVYKEQTDFFNYANLKFEGDGSTWKKSEHNDNLTQVIEIETSPNNPDGKLKRAVLEDSNVKTIYDYAYYWPHFSPITIQLMKI
ncbi:hypothetical protein Bca4012_063372 [Brassica carinata]|uniref:Uncharacterized protein n=1 Tax=Brassica carinata TaxID=52824 RepID=A0A8X7SF99_BRACI|nr:hypothetical protein Bca52824_033026 [Brassica carinata]